MSICTFPVMNQNTSRQMLNKFWKRLFNATVYKEFLICFTIAKYENVILSLCETINVFIDAFCYSKIQIHQLDRLH